MKNKYEEIGGTYREENGIMYPNLALPEQSNCQIGKYGKMHLDYIKHHRRGRYSALLGKGQLNTYLSKIDEQVHELLSSLTAELAKTHSIDEYLKATDQMRWVQMMNNVRAQAGKIMLEQMFS